MSHPMLLTERDWQWWFGVSGAEAARLVRVQWALASAGVDPCPETALGMSRTVLAGGFASQRLRMLAELWERTAAPPVDVGPGWPIAMESPTLRCHLRGMVSDGLQLPRCRRQAGNGAETNE